MKAIRFRRFLWRLINKIYPPLAARLKITLLGVNRLGIQFQTEHQAVLDYMALVKPPVWKSINVVNPEFLAKVAAANPNALGIYRAHPNSYWADDPERRAAEHVGRIAAELRQVSPAFHIIEENNEYVFPFDSPERIDAADRYMAKFVELCSTVLGKKALVLNAATGNWGDDITVFHRMLEALKFYGGFIGFHEYDFPTMWRAHQEGLAEGNEGMWHCLRWKRAARTIKQLYDGWCPKFIISEGGLDSGAKPGEIPQRGFRGVHPDNLDASVENYIASLLWCYDHLDDDVFAVTLFGCGMTAPWDGPEGFDIKDTAVPYRISLFPAEEPPEPPPPEPPPNGGDPMVKIYDFDNDPFSPGATTRDWPWLRSIFGPDLLIHAIEGKEDVTLTPGDIIYKVQWLDCKVGETGLGIHVEGVDGNAQQGKLPVFGWPKAEAHGLSQTLWKLWTNNGVAGPTNENGDVHPGMGTGAYYDWSKVDPGTGKLECGPHFVYVWDLPADMVTGLGMLPWHPDVEGNHLHVNIGYRAEVYGGEPPLPPTPPVPPGDLVAAVNRVGDELAGIGDELAGIRRWLEGKPPGPPSPPLTFKGQYYNNKSLSGPMVLVRDDGDEDGFAFDWGADSPAPGKVNTDDFSVRWTGQRIFEEEGAYRFKVRADDGVRLWVDEVLIIDEWRDQGATTYEATVTLMAGLHDIRMEYYERGGASVAELSWTRLPQA